jgi:hypothetical protein
MSGRPLAIDLFTGLHGWAEGLIAAGFYVVGVDIVDMSRELGEAKPDHFSLIVQDVLTLHGSQFKRADLIVGSSPCTKYSYMAMPWTRSKALAAWYRDPEHPERLVELNALYDAQFRIQREASQAAGRHIPMVVENVVGAQPWVGRARAKFGSIALWGDVPALLPYGGHRKLRGDNGPRMWSDRRVARLADEYRYDSDAFFTAPSGSAARKAASAKIAKIPFPLARWIGKAWLPIKAEAA